MGLEAMGSVAWMSRLGRYGKRRQAPRIVVLSVQFPRTWLHCRSAYSLQGKQEWGQDNCSWTPLDRFGNVKGKFSLNQLNLGGDLNKAQLEEQEQVLRTLSMWSTFIEKQRWDTESNIIGYGLVNQPAWSVPWLQVLQSNSMWFVCGSIKGFPSDSVAAMCLSQKGLYLHTVLSQSQLLLPKLDTWLQATSQEAET